MSTTPRQAGLLLKAGRARILRRDPFTIQLLSGKRTRSLKSRKPRRIKKRTSIKRRRALTLFLLVLLIFIPLIFNQCSSSQPSSVVKETIKSPTVTPKTTSAPISVSYGQASFYASYFHGKVTASGEYYDEEALTASHRSFKFGSRVRVTNLSNQKSVVVLINDRGPFIPGRIIDLSKKAAQEIDFLKEGIVSVKVELLTIPD
ncbi:MAG: septal ring lytic transglycosylase RlpA family protein [Moorea sp. SIO2B7]|nr:septal ring lytic transglycosylase RlpA family protein [Moorena sp. SIO2B7]